MSDIEALLSFARRSAVRGAPVDGRQVGYILAELDRLHAVVDAVREAANRAEEPFATHPRSEAFLIDEINDIVGPPAVSPSERTPHP